MSLIIPFTVGDNFVSYGLQEEARLWVLLWKPLGFIQINDHSLVGGKFPSG